MLIGHFGVGLAAKRATPAVSLGTLFLAAQFLDLLWPDLLLAGIEKARIDPNHIPPLDFTYYPISHSLLGALIWAALFGAVYYVLRRRRTAAVVTGLAVLSHWVLDLVVHHRDLPLLPGGVKVGLGLWSYPIASNALEFGIFGVGLWLYLRTTAAVDRTGVWALRGLVAFLALVQIANAVGSPPPSITAVAWAGEAQWLLVIWGYWVDHHRRTRGAE